MFLLWNLNSQLGLPTELQCVHKDLPSSSHRTHKTIILVQGGLIERLVDPNSAILLSDDDGLEFPVCSIRPFRHSSLLENVPTVEPELPVRTLKRTSMR